MNLAHIGAGIIVLFLPGLACLAWLKRRESFADPVALLADAAGLSVSLTALAGLVGFLFGLRPGALGTAFLYGVCLATFFAALVYRGLPRLSRREWLVNLGALLAAGVGLATLVWFRLYQARDLVLPNWVDSVHHTLIVRVILEHGGVPGDLLPYLDAPFSYHYGFHLIAAAFAAWTGLPPEQTVLVFGQAVNALIALSIYRLARALGLDWKAAGVAALLTGFVLHMPAYYLTWGRYTLSTGLVVLFPAMATALELYRQPLDRRIGVQLMLLTAGVCLSQYLAVVFILLFLLVLGAAGLGKPIAQRNFRALPWQLAGWSLAGGMLALPWLLRALQDNLNQATLRGINVAVQASDWNYIISLTGPRYNHILLAVAGAGLLFASRKRSLHFFSAWTLLMLFFSQPFAVRLGPFRPDLYVIVLFAPAAIYLADLLGSGAELLGRRARPWLGQAGLALVTALLLAWGVREMRSIVNPGTVIADRADLVALEWARANIPETARFYINSTSWQGSIERGTDGGYWLMPFAGFYTVVPPVPYMWESPESVAKTNRLADEAQELSGCTPAFWDIVRDAQLSHVYLHDGKGSLQASALDGCPRLTLLYREQGVSIYSIEGLQ